MARKSIILYDLKSKKTKEKTDITRKLFGFKDESNNGNYTYEREGLLKNIKHQKWNKVAILINSEDEAKVSKILRKFGLKVLITRLPE
ncbi:MAG: hypothetical protein AABW64_02905 [Nanoarchaeota archaeon]